MKKKLAQIQAKPGWNAETGVATKCKACKKWLSIGDRLYWRKIDGGTEIRCAECADIP